METLKHDEKIDDFIIFIAVLWLTIRLVNRPFSGSAIDTVLAISTSLAVLSSCSYLIFRWVWIPRQRAKYPD